MASGVQQEEASKESELAADAISGQRRKRKNALATPAKTKRGRGSFGLTATEAPAVAVPTRQGRQPSLVTGGTLREYQLVGMEWLISLYDNGLNGILADEMGLGKTVQAIAFLAHLREMGTAGPFLIVGPLSTLSNWIAEIERFTPSIPVVLYHGNPQERADIRKKRMNFKAANFPIIVTSYEICMNDRKYLQNVMWRYIIVDEGHRIKNLSCRLVKELKAYNSANRLLLTGTPLQNNLSELWSLLNFLMPDIFDDLSAFEGWFEFANDLSGLSGSDSGTTILDKEGNTSLVSSLHQILKPFLLRRIKTEVAVDLPKKREYLLYAPLVPKQKELYDAALRGTLSEEISKTMLVKTGLENNSTAILEKVSSDSLRTMDYALLTEQPSTDASNESKDEAASAVELAAAAEPSESVVAADNVEQQRSVRAAPVDYAQATLSDRQYFKKLENGDLHNNQKPAASRLNAMDLVQKAVGQQKLQSMIVQLRKICNHPYLFDISNEDDIDNDLPALHLDGKRVESVEAKSKIPEIVAWSGKMLILERLLPELFSRGHKVLIFSQMTRMLDIISDWCQFVKKWKFCRIDGMVKMEERRTQIQDFNTDPDFKLFLLSTRAGGLGINLTAADTVIIFDSDWNPQADLQAQDRVHRIGQTKPVVIYRLACANTVECKILEKAQSKRKLEKLVIHKEQFKGSKGYYSSNKKTDLLELAEILTQNETEEANSGKYETVDGIPLPSSVLNDEELERILDRTPGSYEAKNVQQSTRNRFLIVEETQDETNDALAGMNST